MRKDVVACGAGGRYEHFLGRTSIARSDIFTNRTSSLLNDKKNPRTFKDLEKVCEELSTAYSVYRFMTPPAKKISVDTHFFLFVASSGAMGTVIINRLEKEKGRAIGPSFPVRKK